MQRSNGGKGGNARNIRLQWAQETLDILDKGQYTSPDGQQHHIAEDIAHSVQDAVLYRPNRLPEVEQMAQQQIAETQAALTSGNGFATMECTNESTLQAAARLVNDEHKQHVLALNFASARNPGGGFLGGSQAQEESLARSSSLYPSIVQMEEMYTHNRREKSCLYSHYMIYSPDVVVFREDDGQLHNHPYTVSMITSPAVNAGIVQEREKNNVARIETVMKERIRYILAVAAEQGERHLVLGAFGCGVFRNDPSDVARWFRDILVDEQYAVLFEHITFAVLDRSRNGDVIREFRKVWSS
ncbi:TIGR02452 family protein [Paenibacillus kandeliae]|uniref:TIGR02452 family protein n=1 Tax=Paenibacillus kandeliae TaxID=3231269 RepID=UPI00345AB2E2